MTQRTWLFLTPLLIAAVPVLMMGWYMLDLGYGVGDAWAATMRLPVARTDYAMRFSDDELRRVRVDLDDRTVVELLGIPLDKGVKDTVWDYSLPSEGATWYHARQVHFERDQLGILRVRRVVSEFRQGSASD